MWTRRTIRRAGLFVSCLLLAWAAAGHAAVTSTGEINVVDEPLGRVPTSSTPTLILTLLVDRSEAELGEEIQSIEVLLPAGFSVAEDDVHDVLIDDVSVGFHVVSTASAFRSVLDNQIDHNLSSIIVVRFSARTPDLPMDEALFRVALRNPADLRIGQFIKPGEIDGNPNNNNDYTLDVFPNVPPATPTGLTATQDPTGENDVLVAWDLVDDADVQGYFVHRDSQTRLDAVGGSTSAFRDVDVTPGQHSYSIAAYKSRLVISPRSADVGLNVAPDTRPPDAVPSLRLNQVSQGVALIWTPSPSADVRTYEVIFSLSVQQPRVVETVSADSELLEYEFLHRQPLDVGRYGYGVVAVDEAGNASEPLLEDLVLSQKPYPNPFTPLSGDPTYNRVRFPRLAVPDAGDGDLTVRVFDLQGREVWQTTEAAGDAEWNGRNVNGELLLGGVYVYQIEIRGRFDVGTVVLVR